MIITIQIWTGIIEKQPLGRGFALELIRRRRVLGSFLQVDFGSVFGGGRSRRCSARGGRGGRGQGRGGGAGDATAVHGRGGLCGDGADPWRSNGWR